MAVIEEKVEVASKVDMLEVGTIITNNLQEKVSKDNKKIPLGLSKV